MLSPYFFLFTFFSAPTSRDATFSFHSPLFLCPFFFIFFITLFLFFLLYHLVVSSSFRCIFPLYFCFLVYFHRSVFLSEPSRKCDNENKPIITRHTALLIYQCLSTTCQLHKTDEANFRPTPVLTQYKCKVAL